MIKIAIRVPWLEEDNLQNLFQDNDFYHDNDRKKLVRIV
jgi:hypothetical protein